MPEFNLMENVIEVIEVPSGSKSGLFPRKRESGFDKILRQEIVPAQKNHLDTIIKRMKAIGYDKIAVLNTNIQFYWEITTVEYPFNNDNQLHITLVNKENTIEYLSLVNLKSGFFSDRKFNNLTKRLQDSGEDIGKIMRAYIEYNLPYYFSRNYEKYEKENEEMKKENNEVNDKINNKEVNILLAPLVKDFLGTIGSIAILRNFSEYYEDKYIEDKNKVDKYFNELIDDVKTLLKTKNDITLIDPNPKNNKYINLVKIMKGEELVFKNIKRSLSINRNSKHPLLRSEFEPLHSEYFEGKYREYIFRTMLVLIEFFENSFKENPMATKHSEFLNNIEKALSKDEIKEYVGYDLFKSDYENNPIFEESLKRVKEHSAVDILESL
ncbi:hypothetical protein AR9_g036 [Bacillus phage AR9]|uniref:Uncharacterized protein n=1 Tax=Bacillus phage AR9 TaxID=1815509 RepID=A0A172JHU6_BPPB1|nr:hypothetical protein BI022_gp036 [Bacillus phage AR9]AMS01121.1 hypothetical protein AR9_g036 [Bacillus phage AR9]